MHTNKPDKGDDPFGMPFKWNQLFEWTYDCKVSERIKQYCVMKGQRFFFSLKQK